ncbi:MAG: hypothetical protein AAFU65_12935, partial [Pseudomonadota bacterium]
TLVAESAEVAVALPGASATLIPAVGYWPDGGDQAVITTQRGAGLARRVLAAGRTTVVTSIEGSHRWVMAGAADVHAHYWQTLFDAALPAAPAVAWQTAPAPAVHGRLHVACASGNTTGRVDYRAADGEVLALPSFNTPVASGCVATVPAAGWFELRQRADDAPPLIGQWHASRDAAMAAPDEQVQPLNASSASYGPRVPRVALAWLALLAAGTLWRLERAAWRPSVRVAAEQDASGDRRAA